MKFVCLKCEKYMAFQKAEAPEAGRLGITFACASCGAEFAMVTNPGETQLVSSLGVSLGGRTAPPAPLEMTRGSMKDDSAAESASMSNYLATRTTSAASASAAPAPTDQGGGSCPFSSMVRDMGLVGASSDGSSKVEVEPAWTDAARARLGKLPTYVRQVLHKSVEDYARSHGYAAITEDVMDAAKRGKAGLEWSTEATERLGNIPDFVRPMARKEIERIARSQGRTTVDAAVMDQAKDAFASFR